MLTQNFKKIAKIIRLCQGCVRAFRLVGSELIGFAPAPNGQHKLEQFNYYQYPLSKYLLLPPSIHSSDFRFSRVTCFLRNSPGESSKENSLLLLDQCSSSLPYLLSLLTAYLFTSELIYNFFYFPFGLILTILGRLHNSTVILRKTNYYQELFNLAKLQVPMFRGTGHLTTQLTGPP